MKKWKAEGTILGKSYHLGWEIHMLAGGVKVGFTLFNQGHFKDDYKVTVEKKEGTTLLLLPDPPQLYTSDKFTNST